MTGKKDVAGGGAATTRLDASTGEGREGEDITNFVRRWCDNDPL